MRRALSCAAVALGLAACVAARGPVADTPIAAPFDEGAMGFILKRGSASITGQASLQQPDGKAATAAGAQVELLPATPYTQEVAAKMAGGQTQAEANARLRPFARLTRTDAAGTFQFFGLPAGSYLTLFPFRLEASGDNETPPRSGALWREVRVPEGGQARVVLSAKADGKATKPAP